jgi:hypothetical protein
MKNEITLLDNPDISYGRSVKSNELTQKKLSEILNTIRTGNSGIKEQIEDIRKCQDTDQKQELKKQLPYFNMGLFKDNIRLNANFEQTQFIILDIDHIGYSEATELRQKLKQDTATFAAFRSPSGDGVKVIYRLDSVIITEAEYRRVYQYYKDNFHKQYYEPDLTPEPSRTCFLSYDPDIYVNENTVALSTDVAPQPKVAKKKSTQRDLLNKGERAGDRTPTAAKIIGHSIHSGHTRDAVKLILEGWNQKNNPPHTKGHFDATVDDMYDRYEKDTANLPIKLVVKNGAYHKLGYKNDKPTEIMLTSFIIEPKELLVFDGGDCMRASIETNRGYIYDDIYIENGDWNSKSKLLNAIGHQDCTFHGSDMDVQGLCSYVNALDPVRKKGTKVIGLYEGATWVTKGINITADNISYEPSIISYDKGKSAFYQGISYKDITDPEYTKLLSGIYSNITYINEANIIVPWIAWTLATPVKPVVMDYVGGFPLTFVHGPQGSGKTSTARLLKRLIGYTDAKPHSCKEKAFPMLKLLSSTNAIPVFLDEFKAKLLTEDQMNNIIAYMNKAYSGEVESKGQADQTTKDYEIVAPMCVMGEWNISIPSIHERMLVVRFKNTVKEDKKMQEAFDHLWTLPLEAFMPRYIRFCLQQDIHSMMEAAKAVVEKHFGSKKVAPRIADNLAVMVLGIELFKEYGMLNNITVPAIDIGVILDNQLKEMTGSNSGFVQSAVDQLINELSVMALKEKPLIESTVSDPATGGVKTFQRDPNGYDVKVKSGVDYKLVYSVQDKKGNHYPKALAINFKKIFPDFKEYAKRTGYDGDLLDYESYSRLFDETSYVVAKDHMVNFNNKSVRSLCIDIAKAQSEGINLEGFGIS